MSTPPKSAARNLPVMPFTSRQAWTAWLTEHHTTAAGLWLQIARKDTGIPTVTYSEALDVALCHGWIDGQKDRLDERYWLQRFTPRKPRSRWSKINRDRVAALVEAGAMQPAGLAEVERAKADGRWDAAYDSQRTATVPDDLRQALDADPAAGAFFATLSSANRYAILYRVHEAKRPETRDRRIREFVTMLAEGRTLHP